MTIISQEKDFRNWDTFKVKGNRTDIEKYFTEKYPNNDISVIKYVNYNSTFEVTILPKDEDEE